MKYVFSIAILLCVMRSGAESMTPLDTPLTGANPIRITCRYTHKSSDNDIVQSMMTKRINQGDILGQKPLILHYDLYLPSDYADNPDRQYPVIFIASPGGNATPNQMMQRLSNDRWIIVCLVESSNKFPHSLENLLAAHDDVIERVRLIKNFKFCTGMSGGSRLSSYYPVFRSGFAGYIIQAASYLSFPETFFMNSDAVKWKKDDDTLSIWQLRLAERSAKSKNMPFPIPVFANFGNKDYNKYESISLLRFSPIGQKIKVEIHEGGHDWIPSETFENAMDFMERTLFMEGKRVLPPEAWIWYVVNSERKMLQAEQSGRLYDAYEHAINIGHALQQGQLSNLPRLQEIINSKEKVLASVSQNADIQVEIDGAAMYYRTIPDAQIAFRESLHGRIPAHKSFDLNEKEVDALFNWIGCLVIIVEQYPDTKYARRCKIEIESLKRLFEESMPKILASRTKKLKSAMTKSQWPIAIQLVRGIMGASEVNSNEYNTASASIETLKKVGKQRADKLMGSKSKAKKLKLFINVWRGFDFCQPVIDACNEIGKKGLTKITGKRTSLKTLKAFMKGWEEFAVYDDALVILDEIAQGKLEKILKKRTDIKIGKSLIKFIEDYTPTPSADRAQVEYEAIADELFNSIIKIKSKMKKKGEFKKLLKYFSDSRISQQAQSMLDDM